MVDIVTLPPQAIPVELTAKRPSKTLGEHAEAFKSRNGYEVEPPPDSSKEISGIIAPFLLQKHVYHKDVQLGGRAIRDATERQVRLNVGSRMIWVALGYIDYHDAKLKNEGKDYFVNLNYGRNDLAAVSKEHSDEHLRQIIAAKAALRPMFERVFALPHSPELAAMERCNNGQAIMGSVKDYLSTLGWEFDGVIGIWNAAHALVYRYPNLATLQGRRDVCRLKDYGQKKLLVEASQQLTYELRPPTK